MPSKKPLISIVVAAPVAETEAFGRTRESVRTQVYPNWEFVPAATWDAGARHAIGTHLAFVHAGDTLAPQALLRMSEVFQRNPAAGVLYSDEDLSLGHGSQARPVFKPDWSPESLLSRCYTGQLAVFERELFSQVGGIRPGFDGAEAYDLMLRATERAGAVEHLPEVLYHRRSRARPNPSPERAALESALVRRGIVARVTDDSRVAGHFVVRPAVTASERVSIIILTRDRADLLGPCLSSLFRLTAYRDFEVILVDNGSVEQRTLDLKDEWLARAPSRFSVLRADMPFHFSRLNNLAVERATGKYLAFLNNDTEITHADWLDAMIGYAQMPTIGAVGATLRYADGKVQHAGVVMGLDGRCGHGHQFWPADSTGYQGQLISVNNYLAVTGACLVTRREVFDEVSGFAEDLPVAYNDVDLCLKMIDRGYRNVCLPHAVLIHHESQTRSLTSEEAQRGHADALRVLRARWQKFLDADPYYSPRLSKVGSGYMVPGKPPVGPRLAKISAFVAVAMIVLTGFNHLRSVAAHAVDVPYWDEWLLIGDDAPFPATLDPGWLLHQHNEHRIVPTRFLSWVNFRFFQWDVAGQIVANFVLFLVLVASVVQLIRKLRLGSLAGIAVASGVFLLSDRLRDNHLWSFQSQFHFCILFLIWAALVLFPGTPRVSRGIWGGLLAGAAMLSFSAGVPGALGLLAVFAGLRIRDWQAGISTFKTAGLQLLAVGTVAVAALGAFFHQYSFISEHPAFIYPWSRDFWRFFFSMIAAGFGSDRLSAGAGGVFFLATVLPLVLFWRLRGMRDDGFRILSGIMAAVVAILAVITVGRSGYGIDQAKTSRYLEFAVLLIPLSVSAWALLLRESRSRFGALALIGLLSAVIWSHRGALQFDRAYNEIQSRRLEGLSCVSAYYSGSGASANCPSLFPFDLAAYLDRSKTLRLSFFQKLGGEPR